MTGKTMGSFQGAGEDSMAIKKAVETYEMLAPQKRMLDDLGRANLKNAIEVLMPEQQFIILSTDSEFSGIHARLFDAVHEPENHEDLMGRLGDYGTNKVAMAMAVQDEEGEWFPTAVVYTYWSDKPDLPSNIRPLLEEPLRFLDDKPKVIVPYTISSNFPKAGDTLIAGIHDHIYGTLELDDVVLATLSPLRAGKRGFATWMEEQGIELDGDPDKLMEHAFDYLMPISRTGDGEFITKDAVQSFHMAGKGAMLGAIHFGNDDSMRDKELAHGIMASYIYSPDTTIMAQNMLRFREEGLLTISVELAQYVPDKYHDRLHVHQDEDTPDLDTPPPETGDDYDPDGLSLA